MRITQEETVDLQTVLHIELDDADTTPYLDMGYRKVRPYVSYPGFRKGKVPRHIVMQMMGRTAILNEVWDDVMQDVATKAIAEQELEIGGAPNLELLDVEPLTFKATVPLRPQVDLGAYRDIRVEEEQAEVADEQVQERMEQLRRSVSSWEPAERPVKMGDMITLSATGIVDGVQVLDETDTVYLVNEDVERPFPGFAAALVDAEIDAPKEFELAVADDYPDESVAGKSVQLRVTVSDVKEQILPELDDEFAQGIGEGYDSLEALRERVETELKNETENVARQRLNDAAINSLIEGASAEIPPLLIEQEISYMLSEQMQYLARANIRMDDYMRSMGKTESEYREDMREEAQTRLMRGIALGKLSELEGIEVSDEEVDERIQAALAQNFPAGRGVAPPQVTDEMRDQARRAMHTERTLDRLAAIVRGEAPELPEGGDGDGAADEGGDDPADAEGAAAQLDAENAEAQAESPDTQSDDEDGADAAEAQQPPAQ